MRPQRQAMRGVPWRALLVALAALLGQASALAQQNLPPNSLFLVAKPELLDPNFTHAVVLVTQAEDASTVGVILNRPTTLRLEDFLPPGVSGGNYHDKIYFGGPVLREAIVALFRSAQTPAAAAFHVLKDAYLTMHPDNIDQLLKDPKAQYRLYSGFSGWAPRQLQSEFMRDSWYVLPAEEDALFRASTDGLWEELLLKAQRRGPRAQR